MFARPASWCRYAMIVYLSVNVAQAAEKNTEADDNRLYPMTYEVGDLILRIQDHPYSESLQQSRRSVGGGEVSGDGSGGGFFSVPNQTSEPSRAMLALCQFGGGGVGGGYGRRFGVNQANEPPVASITIDDIIRVLTNTVARDSWIINGGEGEIAPLGTALVVAQTGTVHEQISELLNQLRQATANRRTVTVDARWLLLSSDELDSMLRLSEDGVPHVDTGPLAEFTRRPESIRGIINCFSSQLVFLVSGTRRNVVSGYIPVVGGLQSPDRDAQLALSSHRAVIRLVSDKPTVSGGKAVGYQPVVETSNFGALLEIRPTLMPAIGSSPPSAVVDLKSTVTGPGDSDIEIDDRGGAALAPEVDRVAVEVQEFATSLRMPLGMPILVGGLSYAPGPMSGQGDRIQEPADARQQPTGENRQLYLVLEVR